MSTLEHLKALVGFNTVSATKAELDQSNLAMLEHMAAHLKRCCFTTALYEVQAGKYNLIALSPAFDKKTLQTSDKLGLLLSGHSDTVPFDNNKWTNDATDLTVRDGKAYGRGSCDMKAFLACSMQVIEDMHAKFGNDYAAYPRVCLMATCDEESSMCGAIDLQRLKHTPLTANNFSKLEVSIPEGLDLGADDFADAFVNKSFELIIIGEPTLLQPVVAHKGYIAREICIKGVSTHSSNPSLGINALEFSSTVIQELSAYANELSKTNCDSNFLVPYATLNLGYVRGGHSLNSVCDEVVIGFDMRPMPTHSIAKLNEQTDALYAKLNDKAQELFSSKLSTPSIRARIPSANVNACKSEFVGSAKAQAISAKDGDLSGQFISMNIPFADIPSFANNDEHSLSILRRHLPEDVTFDYVNYCTEASFLQDLGPVVIIGPGSIDQAHGVDEYVALSELDRYDTFLSALVDDFL